MLLESPNNEEIVPKVSPVDIDSVVYMLSLCAPNLRATSLASEGTQLEPQRARAPRQTNRPG